jgi:hypothetical protein
MGVEPKNPKMETEAMFGATFHNLRGGDVVRFLVPGGCSLIGGRIIRDWSEKTARVNPMLCFEHHVVASYGPHGTVVDSANLVAIKRKGEKNWEEARS